MSVENPLWGAPRIHGELLKLGFEVAQSSVAKYMVERHGPPSQGWRIFLRNHAPDIAATDLFIVPTIGFNLLYAFVVVRLNRRELVWINVTQNPDGRMDRAPDNRGIPLAMSCHATSSEIGTVSMARLLYAEFAPWAYATSLSHQRHLGRTVLPKG